MGKMERKTCPRSRTHSHGEHWTGKNQDLLKEYFPLPRIRLACPVGFHHCYRWTSSGCGLTIHSFPKACVCCGVSSHWFLLSSCMSRSKGATCGSGVVKSTRLCLTLCNPVDCSLPGSSVHGILQARRLEWEAALFSRGSSQPRDRTQGWNPGLPHYRWIPYPLSHQGSETFTRILGLWLWYFGKDLHVVSFKDHTVYFACTMGRKEHLWPR